MAPGGYVEQRDKVNGEEEEQDYPLWRLAGVAGSWIGIQMLWGTNFSVTQPYMEQGLGMSSGLASLTWIWGPITGFFVAPLVGAASDRCESRFGRRRPFMVGGLISMTICAFLFGAAGHIFSGTAAQVFALIMFIGMDATINVMQTPVRALVSDLSSTKQQSVGQLFAVGFQGIGGLLASAVMLPFADDKPNKVFEVVSIALGCNLVLMSLACFLGKEKRFVRPEYLTKTGIWEPFTTVFGAVTHMPVALQRVAVVQFFSWFSLFCMWTFKSTWWAEIVYSKVPDEKKPGSMKGNPDGFQANDRIDLVANGLQIVLGLTIAVVMQRGLLKRIKFIYSAMLGVGALLMYVNYSAATGKPTLASITMSFIAVPISAINSFPFSLIGGDSRVDDNNNKEHDIGVQFGVLNLFIVIPQVIVTVANSSMQATNAAEYLFLMCAISWTLATIAALFVKDEFVYKNVNLVRESLSSAAAANKV